MTANMFYSMFIAVFSTSCGFLAAAAEQRRLVGQVDQLRERVAELESELADTKEELAGAKQEYDELYEEDDEYIERKRQEFREELAKKDDMIGMLVFSMGGGVLLTALVIFASIVKASPLLR